MITEARRRTKNSHLLAEYRIGDAHHLPFADNSFDGCCSMGLFEVVENPQQAPAEMIRVIKPGAPIVIETIDFGTTAVDATDRVLTRKALNYWCDHETNGWIGRQLPGFCAELGLMNITLVLTTWSISDYAFFHQAMLSTGWMERAQAAGALSTAEVATWLADLQQRAAVGRFLWAQLVFTVSGHKP
jgi:ubiquinone/menaquinone biosynthesis C-methylase UbiE